MSKSNTKTAETVMDNMSDTVEQSFAASDKVAKDMMNQGMKMWTDMQAAGQKNMEAWLQSSTLAIKGSQDLMVQMSETAKVAFEDNMQATKALSSVKTAQEAVELQSTMMQTMATKHMSEAKKLGEASISIMQTSMEPLNKRLSEGLEPAA